ncbi:MAG: GNAT family N-acetyltransferase [Planctomycetota bacterium]|jgi:ribosomal protein S18 acetylase RimI-like enzyme
MIVRRVMNSTSSRIRLRAAGPGDDTWISELDTRLFPYAGLRPSQVAYYRRRSPDLVLIAGGAGRRKVGFLLSSLVRYRRRPVLHIVSMGVIRSMRGRGIARRLLRIAFRRGRALGAGRVRLEVWTGNRRALRLYESLGFETTYRRLDYYEPGCDAFVMRKSLTMD